MIDPILLRETLEQQGLPYSDSLCEKLDQYAEILVDWNQRMNLTAITDPSGIVVKHFADCRPDIRLTLLDSLNKRIVFLQELTKSLGIEAICQHARAEEAGKQPGFREKYDLATARAVSNLRNLSEYCLPFVKIGGCFAALKGYDVEEELNEAAFAIRQMGGEIEAVKKYDLGEEARRAIVLIRKVRPTPAKYPRPAAKMKKSPLLPR